MTPRSADVRGRSVEEKDGLPRVGASGTVPLTYDIVEPNPGVLMESLRAFGYSLPTAIADLIDNSISAGATEVHVDFRWDGADSFLLIRDDGAGMTESELISAMRHGSRSPNDERSAQDLGRFGLGLKTASLSQCRRLTVSSRAKRGRQTTRRWDLDYVVASREWRLLRTAAPGSEGRLPSLAQGTAVLWEGMDRVVPAGSKNDEEKGEQRFWELVDEVKQHLRMVFHRYIEDPKVLTLFLNGNVLQPWDPFLVNDSATQLRGEETLAFDGKRVFVRAFVLPHKSKLTPAEYEDAAGPRGWTGQQGFYVYRERRLLVAGDWLGLGFQKEEHHRLARLQVDLPNSMDSAWAIDVKKSRATPPAALRDRLRSLAKIARASAGDVFRHRGKLIGKQAHDTSVLWQRRIKSGRVFYTINREHPLVATITTGSNGDLAPLAGLLRLLEETVPTQTIVIDSSERPDCFAKPFEFAASPEVREVMVQAYSALRKSAKLDAESARRRIKAMEAFSAYPELIADLPDHVEAEAP